MLRMGLGKVDATPALGFRMAGSAPFPRAEGVAGPLQGRVVVAEDDRERVAIVCLDVMALPASEVALLRDRLAGRGAIDADAILVACSHTHAAPFTFLAGTLEESAVFSFLDELYGRIEMALEAAVADLRPVELSAGRVTTDGWAFNRRAIFVGDQVATHGPAWGEGFVRMEDEPDTELQVLIARDERGVTAGGLVGFACHPTVMMAQPLYSADYPGVLTEELEARYGGVFGFLLGASADTAGIDPSTRDPEVWFGWDYAQRMGRTLAEGADAVLTTGHAVNGGRVRHRSTHLLLPQRRPTVEQIERARWYLEEAPDDLDEHAFTRQLYGRDFTFYDAPPGANERHARELLGMWEWQRRAGPRELIDEVEIQALAIGDVAIVALPVELFTAFGRELKERSPFAETFVATMANGWHGYVPTEAAFGRGGYEPFLAYQSRLIPEAGDLMTDAALDLLNQLVATE
jgi:neutral ceramidase